MSIPLHRLGRAVKKLQNRHHRTLDTELIAIGTTLAQWDALRAIDHNPGASAHVLAEYTFQTDQAFGALATKLVSLGLVERKAGKGRAIVHTLTDAGRTILENGHRVAEDILKKSFAPLSEQERAQLLELLEKAGNL